MIVLWRPAMVGANNMLGTNVKRRRIVQVWSSGTGTGVQFGSKPSRPSRKIALHLLFLLLLLLLLHHLLFFFSSSFSFVSFLSTLSPYSLPSPPTLYFSSSFYFSFLTTNPSPNPGPSVPVCIPLTHLSSLYWLYTSLLLMMLMIEMYSLVGWGVVKMSAAIVGWL